MEAQKHPANKYFWLRVKIFLKLILKGKLSFRKLFNASSCFIRYYLGLQRSANFPLAVNMDLSNKCNANCRFCRTADGKIYDQNPNSKVKFVNSGSLPIEIAEDIIFQIKDWSLIAVLYINGEPLIYKDLARLIEYATSGNLATMIATNGQLLTKETSKSLIESGLDFVKVAISGFSQETYSKQVRFGSVEKVKENFSEFVKLNKSLGNKTLLMLDFIIYDYNKHELDDVRNFCNSLGIMLSIRRGNIKGLESEPTFTHIPSEVQSVPCDFLWKMMTINFDGSLYPCCDYVVWSDVEKIDTWDEEFSVIEDIWNGPKYQQLRTAHLTKGRSVIPICSGCSRTGTAFKY